MAVGREIKHLSALTTARVKQFYPKTVWLSKKNQFLDKVEDFVSAKGMDEAIEEKLQSYLDHANLAKTARMHKDNEDVVPIVS